LSRIITYSDCNSACSYIGELATLRMLSSKTLFNVSLHFSVHDRRSFRCQVIAYSYVQTDRPTQNANTVDDYISL